MSRDFQIRLVKKYRKKGEGNNVFQLIGTILIAPFVFLFSMFVLTFVSLFSMFSKKGKVESNKEAEVEKKAPFQEGSIFTSIDGMDLKQFYEGELRNGPVYISLECQPELEAIEGYYYGDWFYKHKEGVFLQRWHGLDSTKADLIYLTKEGISVVKEAIPSILWNVRKDNNQIVLECNTGKFELEYLIS